MRFVPVSAIKKVDTVVKDRTTVKKALDFIESHNWGTDQMELRNNGHLYMRRI